MKDNLQKNLLNSFVTEVPIIHKPVHIDLQSKLMDWFLYDKDLRHERVKPFLNTLPEMLPSYFFRLKYVIIGRENTTTICQLD